MTIKKGDPKLAIYRAETDRGAKNLTRVAARSMECRLAPKTHWEERWIGVIKGYPKTPETFEARKQRGREHMARMRAQGHAMTREGVPDGWKGRKAEIAEIKKQAAAMATEIITEMAGDHELSADERLGNEALRGAFEIVLDKTVKSELRLKAATLITNYTKVKPDQTAEAEVSPAEKSLFLLHNGKLTDDAA